MCCNGLNLANRIAPNGRGLRRAPEPDRGEGACGWSGAMQRRGTPSPAKYQVTKQLNNKVYRAKCGPLVRRRFVLRFLSLSQLVA